jgi:hypothetical protein
VNNRQWTDEERAIVRAMYECDDYAELSKRTTAILIAQCIDRTPAAIEVRWYLMQRELAA